MTDVDKIAHGIATKYLDPHDMYDEEEFNVVVECAIRAIKSALQVYGDECAKEMRDNAAETCDVLMRDYCSPMYCAEKIRVLPLPSEKVKS